MAFDSSINRMGIFELNPLKIFLMDNVELKPSINFTARGANSTSDSPVYSLFDEVWKVRKALHFEIVKTSFDKHDNNHFETTLTYQKASSNEQVIKEYDVDFFFFIPNSVIPETYSSHKLLSSLINHMRLTSLELKPSVFLSSSNIQSPFGKLQQIKESLLKNPNLELGNQILKEFRTAAVYILGTFTRLDISKLVTLDYDLGFHYNVELELSRELLKSFRLTIREFNSIFSNKFESQLAKCLMIEEYLSYQVEKAWLSILEGEGIKSCSELKDKIRLFLAEEYKHRKHFQFLLEADPELLKEDQAGETFSYRLGVLKKFIQEQLYLRVIYKNNNSYAIQSAAMLAAGFAGVFAYSIELLNRGYLGYSWEYNAGFLLTVSSFAYVLKDRIKDVTKSLFQNKWRRYDLRRDLLVTGINKRLAQTIEKVEMINPDSAPKQVVKLRNNTEFRELKEHRSEKVIHYSKKVRINWKHLRKYESESAESLKEIYRFDLSTFLRLMDDAYRDIRLFNPRTGAGIDIDLPRVYHINCVLSLKPITKDKNQNPKEASLYKVRVVLDKSGIKRIEH
ncbi:MAG: hypothetical protein R3A13_06745 [Bdellovibrionota bacterium]